MANSKTVAILEDIKTIIQGVTVANGYRTDFKQVKRLSDSLRHLFTSFPSARIWLDDLVKTDSKDAGFQKCTASISVDVYIENTVDPETDVIHAMDDIEKAIAVDIYRGGLAWTTKTTRQNSVVSKDRGGVNGVGELDIIVEYEHPRGDPYDE